MHQSVRTLIIRMEQEFVGEKRQLYELLKNITLDIVIRHFYKDVHLVYMLEQDYLEQFQWVRWLKNVDNEMLDVNNIICDEEVKI